MSYRLFAKGTIILLLLLTVSMLPAEAQRGSRPFTVVIDPGHGGVDPGAIGRRVQEKEVNFKVSNLLGDMITEAFPEIKVIYTRTTDVKIPLARRADIANDAKADIFISIHSNASSNRSANGCQTFTLGAGSDAEAKAAAMYENEVILTEENHEELYNFDPRSSESYIMFELIRGHDMELSVELAEMVQRGMTGTTSLRNRGVSSAGFLVLHRTVMPSILVELAFISNRNDENVLMTAAGQKNLAQGIFNGFAEYYRKHGQGRSSSSAAANTTASSTAATTAATTAESGRPLFKVQIMASDRQLSAGDRRLKGLDAEYYIENGMYKYTYCASYDYDEIARKRREILHLFDQAFIVAFIDGEKVNTQEAIRIFRNE